jgi:Amt family ammonium transporter
MDSGSIAWMLIASALVLLMTPGLAFFYGGLVRGKNVISTIMYSFISIGIVSIVWVLWGYSLAFGGGGAFIGTFDNFALSGVDDADGQMFAVFQMMFAIITPALITGAFCERFNFKTYMVFLVLWVTLVYAPICHWVWHENGWLFQGVIGTEGGALDFAGGTVVHINAGMAAIAAAALVGRRRNVDRGIEPHNVPYVILGASILWFGWFGFNAGSGLAANGTAVTAFLVTNTCAAVAMMVWVILGMIHGGKVNGVGAASGAVAGLVTITPAAGFVGVGGALALGVLSGVFTFYAVQLRNKTSLDDALDVFAIHGIGGIVGAVGTGIFATSVGLIYGKTDAFIENIIAVLATMIYSLVVSLLILKILDVIPGLGLRSSESDEDNGLDISDHGERAYVADGAD